MSNTTQLQSNNETLASILSNVLGLPSQESLKHGAYVWKKLTAQGGDFVDFVVSDQETAYPDGEEQDGYWYEKVVEGKAGIDFGEVTLVSTATSVTVNHNLGVVPSYVALLSKNFDFIDGATLCNNNGNTIVSSSSDVYLMPASNNITATEITFNSYNSYYKYVAADYYWIAIA